MKPEDQTLRNVCLNKVAGVKFVYSVTVR